MSLLDILGLNNEIWFLSYLGLGLNVDEIL